MAFQITGEFTTYQNGTLRVNDTTDAYAYPGGEEPGHTAAAFDSLYKIIILDYSTGELLYTFSALGDGDELIENPPSEDSTQEGNYRDYVPDNDGIYSAYIVAIPTWDATAQYEAGDCVYYSGAIYRGLLTGTNQDPATETDYWEVISEDASISDTITINKIPSKYMASGVVVTYGTLVNTYSELAYRANVDNALLTGDPVTALRCPEYLDMVRLYLDYRAIIQLISEADYTAIGVINTRIANVLAKYDV